jgi:hypothetical protein
MNEKEKYKKCNLAYDKNCGLPCPDITDDGYCTLQPIVKSGRSSTMAIKNRNDIEK